MITVGYVRLDPSRGRGQAVPYEDLTGTVVHKICMACSREFPNTIANCPHDGNTLVFLPQDQWIGKRLDNKFAIQSKLGTGGMGEVYLAWHELIEKWVAIKFLKSSFIEDRNAVLRFQQEAKAAGRLKHDNVIMLHDIGIAPSGQPYMVMDYLKGYDDEHPAMSLAQLIKQKSANGGNLQYEVVITIIGQACDALHYAHRQGVIHRDIKPANIMIVPREDDPYHVKVVDFGVAKLLPINNVGENQQAVTQFGEVCGSPVYMSPEQCMGQALDSRADIYSMGVVLYESITGKVPLLGRNMVETMQKHMSEKPKPFNSVRNDLFIPEKLEQVVMRALAKEPHARQQTMAELAQDLRFSIPRVGGQSSANLKMHEIVPLVEEKEPANNRPWLIPAVSGAAVAIAAVGLMMVLQNKPAATTTATSASTSINSAATTSQPVPQNNPGTASSQNVAIPSQSSAATVPPTSAGMSGIPGGGNGHATQSSSTSTTSQSAVNPILSPSSAGSPATTGGISATISTISSPVMPKHSPVVAKVHKPAAAKPKPPKVVAHESGSVYNSDAAKQRWDSLESLKHHTD